MSKYIVVDVAEGQYEGHNKYNNYHYAQAYTKGFQNGAGCYGAGSARAYILPNELDKIPEEDYDGHKVRKRVIERLEKRLGESLDSYFEENLDESIESFVERVS